MIMTRMKTTKNMNTIEPSVNDQLRFANLVKGLENLDRKQLIELATELARFAFVMQSASLRWAAHEAANNLSQQWKDPRN